MNSETTSACSSAASAGLTAVSAGPAGCSATLTAERSSAEKSLIVSSPVRPAGSTSPSCDLLARGRGGRSAGGRSRPPPRPASWRCRSGPSTQALSPIRRPRPNSRSRALLPARTQASTFSSSRSSARLAVRSFACDAGWSHGDYALTFACPTPLLFARFSPARYSFVDLPELIEEDGSVAESEKPVSFNPYVKR